MKVLVAGANGATGKYVVEQLLAMNYYVKVIVRSSQNIPNLWSQNKKLILIQATILDIPWEKLEEYCKDCDAIISCLGHNLSFKGLFWQPRRLVTDAVKLLCDAVVINNPQKPVKFILMNTSGNSNRDVHEVISGAQKAVIGLLRILIPPHKDNEVASDYLRTEIGQNNPLIEWAVVRPDGLVNHDEVSPYELFSSPVRSAIFNPGKTSRINVAHFMTALVSDKKIWQTWKWQMPVVYNKETS